jgi:uncharacterized protein
MEQRMRKLILSALIVLFSLPVLGQNLDFLPQRPSGHVNDYADMLNQNEENQLERKLRAYRDSTSNVIAVAIIESLEGNSREEVASELFNNWRMWEGDRYNGVLILIAEQDRELKIEVGYGLEGAIPDAMANRIVQDILIPNLRSGTVYAGLDRASDAMIQLAAGEYEGFGTTYDTRGNGGSGIPIDVIIIIVVIIIFLVSKGGRPRGGKRTIGADDVIEAIFWSQIFGGGRNRGGGSGFGGGGGFGSGGGGGFGGFGGGGGFGSGGGGAGGSW